jgi:hypothetical protein
MPAFARSGTAAVAALLLLTAAGCGDRRPPVEGAWTGPAGPATALLTLERDGTGVLSVPPVIAGVRVTWERKGADGLTLRLPAERVGAAPGLHKAGDLPLPATLSDDGRTMTVTSLPVLSPLRLTRAEAATAPK